MACRCCFLAAPAATSKSSTWVRSIPRSTTPESQRSKRAATRSIDHVALTPGVPTEESDRAYRDLVATVPPGLSFLAFHCCAPGDIEAIVPPRAHWRTDEYRIFQDRTFLDWLAKTDIRLIGFREIREFMDSG